MKIKELVALLKQYPQDAFIGAEDNEYIEIEAHPFNENYEVNYTDTPGEYDPKEVYFTIAGGRVSMFKHVIDSVDK